MNNFSNEYSTRNNDQVHCGISIFKRVTTLIATIGAIGYAVTGLFNIHILNSLIGPEHNIIENIIYILIGASGAYTLIRKIIKWSTKKDEHSLYNSIDNNRIEPKDF